MSSCCKDNNKINGQNKKKFRKTKVQTMQTRSHTFSTNDRETFWFFEYQLIPILVKKNTKLECGNHSKG